LPAPPQDISLSTRFFTLGCRLNQLETDSIINAFQKSGCAVNSPSSTSDLVVINTCTVTSKAEQKARRLIRLALKENPEATILVTGCYAELSAPEIAGISPRVIIVPGSKKSLILALAEEIRTLGVGHSSLADFCKERLHALETGKNDPFAFAPDAFTAHSRASIKIEDGCDNACAFCRVHIARGKSLSLDLATVLSRVQRLESQGSREVVLTGVNLSQYSTADCPDFPELLSQLLAGTSIMSFRVSSFEPDKMDERFLRAISHERVRPFFHLPVQSGSPSVLRHMYRNNDISQIVSSIDSLRRIKDNPFIAFDLITGFPGESDGEFAETLDFIERTKPAWIHVFPFSPRQGTPAERMRPHVPERVSTERAASLTQLAVANKKRYSLQNQGKVLRAIVENTAEGEILAFTENALMARVEIDYSSNNIKRGDAIQVKISNARASSSEIDLEAQLIRE
jgi:threonylcarbamoyladenosine tRNA methylthiotransferase MtaB